MKQSVSLLETKRRALSPLFFLYLRSDSFNSHSFILKPILLIKAINQHYSVCNAPF